MRADPISIRRVDGGVTHLRAVAGLGPARHRTRVVMKGADPHGDVAVRHGLTVRVDSINIRRADGRAANRRRVSGWAGGTSGGGVAKVQTHTGMWQ